MLREGLLGSYGRRVAVEVVPPQEVALQQIELGCHGADCDLKGAKALVEAVESGLNPIDAGFDAVHALAEVRAQPSKED